MKIKFNLALRGAVKILKYLPQGAFNIIFIFVAAYKLFEFLMSAVTFRASFLRTFVIQSYFIIP